MEWVNISEKLPLDDQYVLLYDNNPDCGDLYAVIGVLDYDYMDGVEKRCWHLPGIGGFDLNIYKFWAPLPKRPKI